MSTPGTITNRTVVTGTDNPAYQVSKDEWDDTLVVGGGNDGDLMVRDSGNPDGWGWLPFTTVSPITTRGDLIVGDAAGLEVRLPLGSTGKVLYSNGIDPSWSATPTLTSLQVGTGVGVLFGGATSSFPGLKRSAAILQARLADDSAFAIFSADQLILNGGGVLPATTGIIRMPSGGDVVWRNNANNANIVGLKVDTNDDVLVGENIVGTDVYLRGKVIYARNGSLVLGENGVVHGTLSSDSAQLLFSVNGVANGWSMNTGGVFVSTGPVRITNGTSAAPAFSFSSATTTGWYYDSVNTAVVVVQTTAPLVAFGGATPGIYITLSSGIYWTNNASPFTSVDVGITRASSELLKVNNGGAGFGALIVKSGRGLYFGGTTSASPALKSSSAELQCRAADDSDYANFRASTLIAENNFSLAASGGAFVAGGNAANTGTVRLANNTGMYARNAANAANIALLRTDASDYVQIGDNVNAIGMVLNSAVVALVDHTSGTVALKRSATTLMARLGDDSGYCTFDAGAFKVGGVAGVDFGPGPVASITVVKGIITAIS